MLAEVAGQAGSQVSAQANTGLDLSLVIAIAALVLSALSPLISALVSGVFNIKEKQLDISAKENEREQEFFYRHRAEVIENYIRATGEEIESLTRTSHANFGSVMGEIYLYVDSSLWPLLDKISQYIHTDTGFQAKDDFITLCKALSSAEIRTQNEPQPKDTDEHQPEDIQP